MAGREVILQRKSCTKVCGADLSDKSCSKMCAVKVFPTEKKASLKQRSQEHTLSQTRKRLNTQTKSDGIFKKTEDDEKVGPSVEDLTFLDIMKQDFYQDEDNS